MSELPEVADLGLHREKLPDGARCEEHEDDGASFRCAICRKLRCEHCSWGKLGAREICDGCAKDGLPQPIAWERRGEIGVMRGFALSVQEILLSPVRFYRTPALENDAVGGFEHGLMSFGVGQIAAVIQALITIVVFGGAIASISHAPQIAAFFGGYGCMLVALIPTMMVHVPVTTMLAVGVASLAIHATLRLLGAASAPFYAGTVRATSYAFATHVLFVVPIVGPLVAIPWTLVLETIGVREVHKTSMVVALLAVLGFRLAIVGAVIALYASIGALVWASIR